MEIQYSEFFSQLIRCSNFKNINLCILLLFVSEYALADESTYINTEYNYMVKFPDNVIGGYCISEDSTGGGFSLYNKEKMNGKCGVLIYSDKNEKSYVSPEEMIANFRNYHNEKAKKYSWIKLIDVQLVNIQDEIGIKYFENVKIIKPVASVDEDGSYPGKSITLDINHDGYSYYLSCTSELEDFDNNREYYEFIIDPFTFLDSEDVKSSNKSLQSIAICSG